MKPFAEGLHSLVITHKVVLQCFFSNIGNRLGFTASFGLMRLTCHSSDCNALVNDSLRDISRQFIFLYLDDTPIFSSHNMEEHTQHVRLELQRVKNKVIHESRKMWVSCLPCEFPRFHHRAVEGEIRPSHGPGLQQNCSSSLPTHFHLHSILLDTWGRGSNLPSWNTFSHVRLSSRVQILSCQFIV